MRLLEAWFPGIRGGEAIASILFGDVNPSGKLPLTFARSEADLAHVTVQGPPVKGSEMPFDIKYTEGLKVGYKWFDAEKKEPLFPFGFGLSYTTYSYSKLRVSQAQDVRVTFEVKNTGRRAGAEIAQVYVSLPAAAAEPPKRLVAWQKIPLDPGRRKRSRSRSIRKTCSFSTWPGTAGLSCRVSIRYLWEVRRATPLSPVCLARNSAKRGQAQIGD